MKNTMIQISKETRQKLQKLRITKLETYDEIINRLIYKQIEIRNAIQEAGIKKAIANANNPIGTSL